MTVGAAWKIFKFLNGPEGRTIKEAVNTNNIPFLNIFLKSQGVETPTDEDIKELKAAVGGFKTPDGKSVVDQAKENAALAKYRGDKIREAMVDSAGKTALKTGVDAFGEGLNVAGDIVTNNGNKLAEAILAGLRTGTAEQDAMYGKSASDRAAEMAAIEKVRRNSNVGMGLKAGSNVVKRALDRYNTQDEAAKLQQAAQYMGDTPSSIYQAMASMNTRMNKKGL